MGEIVFSTNGTQTTGFPHTNELSQTPISYCTQKLNRIQELNP